MPPKRVDPAWGDRIKGHRVKSKSRIVRAKSGAVRGTIVLGSEREKMDGKPCVTKHPEVELRIAVYRGRMEKGLPLFDVE